MATETAELCRAAELTMAHFVTMDYMALTGGATLWACGYTLQDLTRQLSIKIFSLIELEEGVDYRTSHGNALVRVSRTEALLAGRVTIPVDLTDSAMSPRSSIDLDGGGDSSEVERSALIGSALQHVRSLSAEPGIESIAELHQTIH